MKNTIRLFLLLFSLSTFAQVPQTGGSGGGGGGVRYGISTPTVLGTDKKGDEYFRTSTGDNTVSATESYLFDGTQWNIRPTTGIVREGNTVILNNQVFNTNTFVNSTNGTFTIPSAGTWKLRYFLSTDGTGANTNSQFQIVDALGTVVDASQKTRAGSSTVSENLQADPPDVTTTGPTTFFLQGRNGGSGSTTILNVANQKSTISWEKTSGFLAASGQETSTLRMRMNPNTAVNVTGTTSINGYGGERLLYNEITANIGSNITYNSTTGGFTVKAGISVKITANVNKVYTGANYTMSLADVTSGSAVILASSNASNIGTGGDGIVLGHRREHIDLTIPAQSTDRIYVLDHPGGWNSLGSYWNTTAFGSILSATAIQDWTNIEFAQVGSNVFSFPVSSASIVNGVTNTANTGTNFTANVGFTQVNPASLVSAMTITLPASPALGDKVQLLFGGTIGANQPVITTPTIAPNLGQSIYGNITFTQAKGGDEIEYTYISANNWFRTK